MNSLKFRINQSKYFDNIKIIRSFKRFKTVSISIRNGKCEIKCPFFFSENSLNRLIEKKKSWIKKKIDESLLNLENTNSFGENFVFFRGLKLKLVQKYSYLTKIKKSNNCIEIFLNNSKKNDKKRLVVEWLKSYADRYLIERISTLSKKVDINFTSVNVKAYKARWGSCTHKGEISLNWKLIMLPDKVIDYVIIHELSHVIVPNHSKLFWNLVEKKCPNYVENKKWLIKNGSSLISLN